MYFVIGSFTLPYTKLYVQKLMPTKHWKNPPPCESNALLTSYQFGRTRVRWHDADFQ